MEYLSTLSKHTQAVNVVRWAPKGMSSSPATERLVTNAAPPQVNSLPLPATTET